LTDIAISSRAGSLYEAEAMADPSDKDAHHIQKKKRARSHLEFYLNDAHRKIAYAVNSPYGFIERLVQFWSNHFTVSAAKRRVRGLAGPFECEVIRPHLTGRFEDMLVASTRHPAMLIYLDQRRSIGPNSPAGRARNKGLNENLAREILELHTLGAEGGYTQKDVTEFARLLTGYSFYTDTGEFEFRVRIAEPGVKTVLGRRYGGAAPSPDDAVAALRAFARHPSTAAHIARKLAVHFIADDPPAEAIDKLRGRFLETGGMLSRVYDVLIELPEARQRLGEKRKTPFDFIVSALRGVHVEPDWFRPIKRDGKLLPHPMTIGALAALDQPLWSAPSPAGWPDQGDRWITPMGLAGRLQWIGRLVDYAGEVDPVVFLDRVLAAVPDSTRRLIANAPSRRDGIALVLASAEFNSR